MMFQNAFLSAILPMPYPAEGDGSDEALRSNLAKNARYAKPGPWLTKLEPRQEVAFRAWLKEHKVPFDPNAKVSDYDMRGFWLAQQNGQAPATGVNTTDGALHWSDEFKTPYDASFSRQSRYATPDAPDWANDYQLVDQGGHVAYDEALINRIRTLNAGIRTGAKDGVPEFQPVSAAEIARYFETGVDR